MKCYLYWALFIFDFIEGLNLIKRLSAFKKIIKLCDFKSVPFILRDVQNAPNNGVIAFTEHFFQSEILEESLIANRTHKLLSVNFKKPKDKR